MKYKYVGTEEKHLPTHGLTVKPGDVVEVDRPIVHPEFEPVDRESQPAPVQPEPAAPDVQSEESEEIKNKKSKK